MVGERAITTESRLARVRVGRHRGFDRVVFDFGGSKPSFQSVRYVRRLVQDGSGVPVPVAGRAVLEGNLTFGVGVRHRAGFRVFELTGPDRLVVDVAHCQGRR